MTKLIKMHEVQGRTARSRAAIYADIKLGKFPKPVKTSDKSSAWVDLEIEEWIAARVTLRDGGAK